MTKFERVCVAGQFAYDLRSAQRALVGGGEDLVAQQERLHASGLREAELVESIYGWSLRHASGLDGWSIIKGCRSGDLDGSLEAAQSAARVWVAADPERRFVTLTRRS